MSETIEKRLSDLGVTLPAAAGGRRKQRAYCRTGNLLFHRRPAALKDAQAAGKRIAWSRHPNTRRQEGAKFCANHIWRRPKAALGDPKK